MYRFHVFAIWIVIFVFQTSTIAKCLAQISDNASYHLRNGLMPMVQEVANDLARGRLSDVVRKASAIIEYDCSWAKTEDEKAIANLMKAYGHAVRGEHRLVRDGHANEALLDYDKVYDLWPQLIGSAIVTKNIERPEFREAIAFLLATAILNRGKCYAAKSTKSGDDEALASYDLVIRQCKNKLILIETHEARADFFSKKGEHRLAKQSLEIAARLKNMSK